MLSCIHVHLSLVNSLTETKRKSITGYRYSIYHLFLINLTSPFPWLQLDGIFHFYSNLDRTVCKQTVETLIRRCIVWRLIWVCTVCRCPTKWMLGLYGLMYMPGYPVAYCLSALENQRLCRTVRIRRLVLGFDGLPIFPMCWFKRINEH